VGKRGNTRTALFVGICALTTAIAVGAYAGHVLRALELKSVDTRFSVRGSTGLPNDVVVVAIDDKTFSDFNTPYVLFGTAQPPAGDLITFHIYNASFLTWNFGVGAAMSVLLLIFLMIVTGAYLLVTGRRSRRA